MSLKVLLSQPILFVPESTTQTTHSSGNVSVPPATPRLSPDSEKRCVSALSSLLSTFPVSRSPAIALSGPQGDTDPSKGKAALSQTSPSTPSTPTFLSWSSGGRKSTFETTPSVPKKREHSAIELSGPQGGPPLVKRRRLSFDDEEDFRARAGAKVRARGFGNKSGVHCYRNASLQALGHIPRFREMLRYHRCRRDGCPACSLREVFSGHFSRNGVPRTPHEPKALKAVAQSLGPVFARGYNQEDAHEYIGLLLDRLAERSDPDSSVKEDIAEIFGASKISRVECVTCKKVTNSSSSNDLVVMLTLPQPQGRSTSLEACLREHTKEEFIGDYRCESCKRLGIRKSVRFEAPPKVALMALSRFDWRGNKDNRSVSFPEYLDWNKFTTKRWSGSSRLTAVICHESANASSGHYYAVVNAGEGKWLKYNDHHVTLCKDPCMSQEQGVYLLLYSQY